MIRGASLSLYTPGGFSIVGDWRWIQQLSYPTAVSHRRLSLPASLQATSCSNCVITANNFFPATFYYYYYYYYYYHYYYYYYYCITAGYELQQLCHRRK